MTSWAYTRCHRASRECLQQDSDMGKQRRGGSNGQPRRRHHPPRQDSLPPQLPVQEKLHHYLSCYRRQRSDGNMRGDCRLFGSGVVIRRQNSLILRHDSFSIKKNALRFAIYGNMRTFAAKITKKMLVNCYITGARDEVLMPSGSLVCLVPSISHSRCHF